jgi:hypothetical protein
MASHHETRRAARPTSARTHQSDHPTSHLARTHEIHVKCLILNSKNEKKNAPQVELRQETKKWLPGTIFGVRRKIAILEDFPA